MTKRDQKVKTPKKVGVKKITTKSILKPVQKPKTTQMKKNETEKLVNKYWKDWYLKGLMEFIRIPNLTPMVDENYTTNGLLERAMDLVDSYVKKLEIKGIERKVFKPKGMNPLVVYAIAPSAGQTKNVMIYGHLDKQPYEEAWDKGLSPTEPVIKNGRLYGRGANDDGYSVFSSMLAVKVAQLQGTELPRIVMVLETEEESGSPNLIDLLNHAHHFIRTPDVCFCMDSGCLDYKQLWVTSSLRGVAAVDVEIGCGKTGYHSGEVGGIVPETFRIFRALLDRIDNPKSGTVSKEF